MRTMIDQCMCMQVEGDMQAGSPIEARILDVNKKDGIVDVSLRAALVAGPKQAKGKGAGAAAAVTPPEVLLPSCWP